jgi:hypothetical protein
MYILIRALVTFLVVLLILYLVNMLPISGRAREIARVIINYHRRSVTAWLSGELLRLGRRQCAESKAL